MRNLVPDSRLARKQLVLAVLVFLFLSTVSMVPPSEGGWRDEKARKYPPSPYPDRIILTWSGDPATTQSVTWRTDPTVTVSYALITEARPSGDFDEGAARLEAKTSPLETHMGLAHYHSVNFTRLRPGTLYAYRVGSDEGWSEWFQFRTAKNEPESFSFVYLGDAQNGIRSHWARAVRQAYSDAPGARFMVHGGDLVTAGYRDPLWGEWFEAAGWIPAMLPSIPTVGNHEYYGGKEGAPLTPIWSAQFALPANGVPGLEDQTYYIDYQGVRLISLNSNERQEEQAWWLAKVLENNSNRWTVVTFHHTVFTCVEGRDKEEVRRFWKPVLDQYGVDLVLTGHDHVYARGRGESSTGPVYIVSVSGPKMYDLTADRWMDRAGENTQLYQVITVTPDTLHYRSTTVTGDLYDAFDLVKQEDAPNLLIETVPAGMPERMFEASIDDP
jgi:hypothetical protein